MENTYNFHIKFEKQQHSINADTYVQSLVSLSTIVREINYQSGTGPGVTVNVLAEEPGSFDVALQIAEVYNNNRELINATVALSTIVSTVVGLLQLRLMLNGADTSKSEIQGDQVNIKDVDGNVIFQTNNTTYNIYMSNQAVNDALSDQFQAVNKDREVEAVEIASSNERARFTRDDFSVLAEKRIIETADNEEVTMPAQLKISKLVLDNRDRKWEFVYQGVKISARVDDESFWDRILAGEIRFANGDVLVGDLRIIREYDQAVDTYLNKEYIVSNIRQHLPRVHHEQSAFDDINT